LLSVIIIGILLFKQDIVPEFSVGPKGEDAIVDYGKINSYIDNQVNGQPKPQNGKDGTVDYSMVNAYIDQKIGAIQPRAGADGKDASPCTTTQIETGAVITCPDGSSSIISNGQNGADGKTPQLRCNTTKNRWEIRYSDDENWGLLDNKSTPCKASI
jgi:hypothetical protein